MEHVKAKVEEIKAELEVVKAKLGNRADEFVADLESKIEVALHEADAEFTEEVEEFKQLGLFGWIKMNPKAAGLMVLLAAGTVNGVLALFGLHFGL
jgi:hypothetical protein